MFQFITLVECTLSVTHCLRLNLQLHTINSVRTCRRSSFCTNAWQLARFQLTRRIARYLGDSWVSCGEVGLACSTSVHLLFICYCTRLTAFFPGEPGYPVQKKPVQEAQLSPSDRAMRRVSWNLANCHATVQKLLVRQVLNKSKLWS